MGQDERRYSPELVRHLSTPVHRVGPEGPSWSAEGIGRVCGERGEKLTVWLAADAVGRVARLAWHAARYPQVVASTSIFAEWVLPPGSSPAMALEDALRLTSADLAERLGGLPAHKLRTSIVAPQAFRAAVQARNEALGKFHDARAHAEASEALLCHCLGVTGRALAELARADRTFADARRLLGVGDGCGTCAPEAAALFSWIQRRHGDRPPQNRPQRVLEV